MRNCTTLFLVLLTFSVTACQRKPLTAELQTSKGTMTIQLYETDAPKTVANFVGLAKQGYFDGIIFHRVSKGFVIQTGDPTGTGTDGKSIYGGEFEDELNPKAPSYQEGYMRGVVAMANRGPNTNLSQFFILLRDAPSLPKNFTIFGKVVNGMEVADSIAAVDIIPQMGPTDGRPKVDVVLEKVSISR
jgi:cyclophilin family peptidyl-prolyl cis-trans isomerase